MYLRGWSGCTSEGGVYVSLAGVYVLLAGVYVPCKVESLDLLDGGGTSSRVECMYLWLDAAPLGEVYVPLG